MITLVFSPEQLLCTILHMTVGIAFFHLLSVSCLAGLVNQVQSKEYDFDKNHDS